MTRTEMIENIKGFAATFGMALIFLLVATLPIVGVVMMDGAEPGTAQAWAGFGLIAVAVAVAFVVERIIPKR